MFRRHTREPFPLRNIVALSAVVLIVLLFLVQQLKKAGATHQDDAQQPILIETAE